MQIYYIHNNSVTSIGIQHALGRSFPGSVQLLNSEALDFSSLDNSRSDGCCIIVWDVISIDRATIELVSDFISSKVSLPDIIILSNQKEIIPYVYGKLPSLRGILNRDMDAELLVSSIKIIAKGGYCYSWNVDESCDSQLNKLFAANLTPREREILQMYLTGATNKSISIKLCRSEKTISAHKSNILKKLGLRRIPLGLDFTCNSSELISGEKFY